MRITGQRISLVLAILALVLGMTYVVWTQREIDNLRRVVDRLGQPQLRTKAVQPQATPAEMAEMMRENELPHEGNWVTYPDGTSRRLPDSPSRRP
jgi:hypothetical protein